MYIRLSVAQWLERQGEYPVFEYLFIPLDVATFLSGGESKGGIIGGIHYDSLKSLPALEFLHKSALYGYIFLATFTFLREYE